MNQIAKGIAVALLAAGCSNPSLPQGQKNSVTPTLQCGKDTDCKGDRICEAGQCINPAKPIISSGKEEAKPLASTTEQLPDPVPVCKKGDGRKKIPVWKPSVDEDNNLSSDPPQKDGQIVYISLYQDATKTTCDDKELNSFSRPSNPKDVMEGGLAVNIRGNTQFANGICYFQGYYMNEDVMGMHQGWIETYFGEIGKEKIVTSEKYCLSEAID